MNKILYPAIFILCGLASAILLAKISLYVSLEKQDEDLIIMQIKRCAFWRIRDYVLKFRISDLLIGKKPTMIKDKAEKVVKGGDTYTLNDIINEIKRLRALLSKRKKQVRRTVRFLRRHIEIAELKAGIEAGGADACSIALKTGLIFSLTGIIDSLLTNFFNIKKKNIKVVPNFSLNETSLHLSCILKMRFVNIIITVFLTGFIYHEIKRKKGGAGIVTSD